jgi:hypothetical protein
MLIHPIYVKMGIISEAASDIQKAKDSVIPLEEIENLPS